MSIRRENSLYLTCKIVGVTFLSGWGLFLQQKTWSHTAEFKLLAFSVVTANCMELDFFEENNKFVVWLGRFAPFAR